MGAEMEKRYKVVVVHIKTGFLKTITMIYFMYPKLSCVKHLH